jgi:hypothetical protein
VFVAVGNAVGCDSDRATLVAQMLRHLRDSGLRVLFVGAVSLHRLDANALFTLPGGAKAVSGRIQTALSEAFSSQSSAMSLVVVFKGPHAVAKWCVAAGVAPPSSASSSSGRGTSATVVASPYSKTAASLRSDLGACS